MCYIIIYHNGKESRNSTIVSRICIGLHLIQIDCPYRSASGARDNRFGSSIFEQHEQ